MDEFGGGDGGMPPQMLYAGGSYGAPATSASAYDARFIADRYSPALNNGMAAPVDMLCAGGMQAASAAALLNCAGAFMSTSALDLSIDFTRPDGQRTRPLLIDGKRLYVDEHYISVWSPILRSWCIECPDRELILADVQYDHVLELLLAIHPTYKTIDDQTVHILLPLAFDYQMDGLLHRCECFLITNKLPFLEKLWLADRYKLNRLLALLLRELRPSHKLDLTGTRYYGLSDRVKVLLLERIHGAPPPEATAFPFYQYIDHFQELPEPPVDMEQFLSSNDLNLASVRAKTGRSYYVNPYYVVAWSNVFQERLASMNVADDVYCPCTHEELKFFLMAIYPPQLRITETNIGPILMAACKLESHGLLRKCAQILLTPQTQLSVFVRLSLLDRCKLQELLDQCLMMVHRPEHLIEMTQQQTYDCLSIKARAALMDRFTTLIQEMGITLQHVCHRCKLVSSCQDVTWMCPQCKSYSMGDVKLPSSSHRHQQQQNAIQHHHQQQQQRHSQAQQQPQQQIQHAQQDHQQTQPQQQQQQQLMDPQQQQVHQRGGGKLSPANVMGRTQGGSGDAGNAPQHRSASTHR